MILRQFIPAQGKRAILSLRCTKKSVPVVVIPSQALLPKLKRHIHFLLYILCIKMLPVPMSTYSPVEA